MYGIYVLICLPSLSLAYSVVNSYDIVLNDSTIYKKYGFFGHTDAEVLRRDRVTEGPFSMGGVEYSDGYYDPQWQFNENMNYYDGDKNYGGPGQQLNMYSKYVSGWCQMGLMEAPSGAKFCYVSQKWWRGNYWDSDAKCKEIGFDGLAEARTTEDKIFMMDLLIYFYKYTYSTYGLKRPGGRFENPWKFEKTTGTNVNRYATQYRWIGIKPTEDNTGNHNFHWLSDNAAFNKSVLKTSHINAFWWSTQNQPGGTIGLFQNVNPGFYDGFYVYYYDKQLIEGQGWANQFSAACWLKDDTSITAASDKNVFYYQYHPCGNIPHPTNTRFDIDGLTDNNDYNNPSAKDFMHACNYLSTRDKTVTTTMDNYIVMQPMPNLRRANIGFHHICGTKKDGANPCSLKLLREKSDGTSKEDFVVEDSKLHNDGSLMNVTEWYWEHIPLNFINTGTKMMFHANFDSYNGAVNLDNVHFYTKQKCIPRWSRIPDMQFHNSWELDDVIIPTTLDTRAYDFSLLDQNKMVNRFYNSKIDGGNQMERCARLCLMSRSCDMFESQVNSNTCRFRAHSQRKFHNIYELLRPNRDSEIYVLQCSPVSENLLDNSDYFFHTQEPWIVEKTCDEIMLLDRLNLQNKYAGNSFPSYQYTQKIKCSQDEYYKMNQTKSISDLPYGMDAVYLKAVKPQSYIRYWFRRRGNQDRDYGLSCNVTFSNSGQTEHQFGLYEILKTTETYYNGPWQDNNEGIERIIFGPDLSTFDFTEYTFETELHNYGDGAITLEYGPFEYVMDTPYEGGCYEVIGDLSDAKNGDFDQLNPAKAISTCLADSTKSRFALIKNGNELYCYEDIDFAKLQSVPDQNDTLVCSSFCAGGNEYVCGGENAVTIYVATCPGNQVRFGDHCYEEASQIFSLVSDNDDVLKNADACATVGGVLWYPETVEEIKWVAHNFPLASGELYHLGYKNYSQNFGIYAINGQFIAGIPFYTHGWNWQQKGLTGNHNTNDVPLMKSDQCVVYDPNDDKMEIKTSACPTAKGICKYKLIEQHEPIGNNVEYNIMSSEREPVAPDFDGQGTIHVSLLDDSSVTEKFIDVKFSSQILLSAIKFEMPDDQAIKKFWLYVGEAGIQKENILTIHDYHMLQYGNFSSTGAIITRIARFPPIVADRVKLVIEEGAATILAKLELLGMPFEKLYKTNPIFDQIPLKSDFHFWKKTTSQHTHEVGDYGICPHGSIKFSYAISPDVYNNINVFTMSMKVKNKQPFGGISNNDEFFLRMRQKSFEDKYQTMEIFEAGGWNQDPLNSIDDTKLPPGLTMGSQIELEVKCTKDAIQVYLNGYLQFSSTKLHDLGEIPDIKEIKVDKPDGNQNVGPMLSFTYVPKNGIMDLFRRQNSIVTNKRNQDFVQPITNNPQSYGSDSIIKNHFTLIHVYGPLNTDNDYVYQPIQAKQHCYRGRHGALQCRMVAAEYSQSQFNQWTQFPNQYNVQFGGASTQNVKPASCRTGYTAVGHMCLILPAKDAAFYTDGKLECSNLGATMYAPESTTQNSLMAVYLEQEGIDELWIGVKKDTSSGVWKSKGGVPVTSFLAEWAPGEPRDMPNVNCAYLSKTDGYKMKTDMCTIPRKYICMALSPNCPPGYQWISLFGSGRSCFKATGNIVNGFQTNPNKAELNIANKACLKEKTRLATPDTQEDKDALNTAYHQNSGTIKVDQSGNYELMMGFMKHTSGGTTPTESFSWNDRIKKTNETERQTLQYQNNGGNCLKYMGDSNWYMNPCRANSGGYKHYGLCQYTECGTTQGETCKFPYRYKGRLYDTCITLDNLAEETGKKWCSTNTDEFDNHVIGSEQTCTDNCERDMECPIGFWRMYDEDTCYQDSESRKSDLVTSFDEAEEKCAAQGSRLFRIRSTESLRYLETSRKAHFKEDVFLHTVSVSFIAIGMKYQQLAGDAGKKLYYLDDNPVDEYLAQTLKWHPSHDADSDGVGDPMDDDTLDCVGLTKGLFLINLPCNQADYFTAPDYSGNDKPGLSYLCEAKPLKSSSNTYCHFPFVYNNVQYTSCSMEPISGFNPNGKPWCATEVNEDSTVIAGKWVMCEDEREIIYDGSGAGHKCPMPFLYDNIYFDYCTRKSNTSPFGFNDYYWCPDPRSVEADNLYTAGDPVGKCTSILVPEENGCAETYDPITDTVCARISSYSETYEDAQTKCVSEGGYLLYVLDEEVHVGLGELLKEKIKKFPRYKDIKGMWLDADWSTEENWAWRDVVKPFNDFTKWESDVADIGCSISNGCAESDGIIAIPYYSEDTDQMEMVWNAQDKDYKMPYVCMSKCPKYYLWFPDTCFFEDTVYPGTHIQSSPLTTNDPASCQKECQKDDQCQFWSFNTGNGGCKLLAELAAPESSAGGITSGPKFCPATGKCLRIAHDKPETKKTIGEAMMVCSADNARLAAFSSCDSMTATMKSMLNRFAMLDHAYFIGNFFFNDPKSKFYRNWEESKIVNSLGNGVFGLEPAGSSLCNMGPKDTLPSDDDSEAFIALHIYNENNQLFINTQYNQDDYTADREKHGYICEKEKLWGCPEGYYINQGFCYKFVMEEKSHTEAEISCMAEGGILAKPESFTHAEFLESLVTYENEKMNITGQGKVWIGHRLEDLSDDTYFDTILEGHTDPSASIDFIDSEGECIAMILKECDEECCFSQDTGFPNNDISTVAVENITDAASCQIECQKEDECHYWTFISSNGKCWLKHSKTSENSGGGKTSGPKFCPGATHVGWHRDACNAKSNFICQKNETLSSEILPFVKPPKAIFPMSKTSGPKDALSPKTVSLEKNLGYDPRYVQSTSIWRSPIWSMNLDHQSYMEMDMSAMATESLKQFSILLWINPSFQQMPPAWILKGKNDLNEMNIFFNENNVMLEIKWDGGTEKFKSVDGNKITAGKWTFIGITVDGIENKTTIYVNEEYGWTDPDDANYDGRKVHFDITNFEAMADVFKSTIRIGADVSGSAIHPFDGRMSCLQFYDYALDPQTISLKKYCPDLPEELKNNPCLENYIYYDGMCYKISENAMSFAKAEMFCVPDMKSPYESQLMYTDNPKTWDYIIQKVKDKHGESDMWAGLSDRDGDTYYITSYGTNISSEDTLFQPGSVPEEMDPCGFVNINGNGHIGTKGCDTELFYVCSMKPLYAKPDYRCPKDFAPYRGNCYSPDRRVMNYESAQGECARKGAIILPFKDAEIHSFVTAWAGASVGVDVWIGIRKQKWKQMYDNDDSLPQPLQEVKTAELTYSDDTSFDPEVHYALGMRKFEQECYVLKAGDDYKAVPMGCHKEKGFICLWQEYDCPEGYSYVGQLSDGKTCHGIGDALANFDDATCNSDDDKLRDAWIPKTPDEFELYRSQYLVANKDGPNGVWTDAGMDGVGVWTKRDVAEEQLDTSFYTDMRLEDTTWIPPDSILNVNGTTRGCLEATSAGLLHTRLDSECDNEQVPSCQYTACLTTTGKKCLFPFKYMNTSHPDLTYTICSTLDAYRPWCPTELDEQLNVIEWGDCMDYCPTEPVNSACLEEPEFPVFSDGTGLTANYTSTYERGSGIVTDEFDFVAFSCPLGYVYEGTNNISHYAVCHDWQFIYLYDPEVMCVPVECPPAPYFQEDTPEGETTWDPENDVPLYSEVATYFCPEGYVFEIYEDPLNVNQTALAINPEYENYGLIVPETDVVNLTCAAFADWSPSAVPPCVPKNCSSKPYPMPMDDKGMYDWDEESRKYQTVIKYSCPKAGWGYPSNGASEIYSICQADKSWNVTFVEECILLPCPKMPPGKPEGGWFEYDLQNTKYKCPNGYEFLNNQVGQRYYPYWYSNCTIAKAWDPPALDDCVPRQCLLEPPSPFFGIEMIWPKRSRDLATMITYNCPFRTGTWAQELKHQYVHCKWDKDTDQMVWWPPYLQECNRKLYLIFEIAQKFLISGLCHYYSCLNPIMYLLLYYHGHS